MPSFDSQVDVLAALRRLGLAGRSEVPVFGELTGGVASDIWRVDLETGPVCVKRALAKLRVDAEWYAPVERNLYEVRWFEVAGEVAPAAVPGVMGRDEAAGLFVMDYLDPADHRLWKAELLAGRVDAGVAGEVGERLARIHAGTAGRADVAVRFPTDAIFHAIRLEPYLEATAAAHPELASALFALSADTARTKLTLVHGDVSPKNIQIGPGGPLFLDAECAWYGDPAFDVAFCLNHLLLKCLVRRDATEALLASFDALSKAYLAGVNWEPRPRIDERAARLLPGLMLARVDGKSPVEYLTQASDRSTVRNVAKALLRVPPAKLASVRDAWEEAIGS
ncbi:MAG: phosphotransferase [Gammaproteobacteria bacterium]